MTPLTEVVVGDDPGPWADAGFAVDGAGTRVGAVRLVLAGPGDGPRITRWAFAPDPAVPVPSPLEPGGTLDGLPTAAADPPAGEPPVHPNGAVVLDHLVVFSPDVDRTTDAFAGIGLDVRRVRPIPGSQPPRVQVFFRAGEVIIELVGPAGPSGRGSGKDGGRPSPATFYGLAFTVADLDATAALLGDRLSEIRPAVQPGRRIATLRHRELGITVPVAFLSERARDDASRAGSTVT